MARYVRDNSDHLAPWSPPHPPGIGDAAYWTERLAIHRREAEEQRSLRFCLIERDSDRIIGVAAFTNIVRGPFQACNLGYAIDHRFEGRGLMTEALRAAIDHAFGALGLHRIMANHLPENERSARLLARLGFRREGLAERYLFIAGAWRDHVLNALVNPSDAPPPL